MPILAEFPPVFLIVVAVLLGLVLGSFLNVVIYRLPRGESIAFPGSHCTACASPIRARDNVPLLGWLLLRGRARCCGAKISPRYPLVELLGGLAAWAVMDRLVLGLPGETSVARALFLFSLYLALVLGLIALALIDIEYMILPDEITLPGIALGLITAYFRPGPGLIQAALGAAAGFLVVWLPFDVLYRKLRGVAGMGLGDAKLLALSGAWFGWVGATFTLLSGAVQATVVTLLLLVLHGRIEEPEKVTLEREELRALLEAAEGEERAELERELALDPLAQAPEPGLG
ncbi:MAG TPA: prepilin peptidase, partial [Polyangiaceae bacterium]|nr:prepilin peptidase [Polyangiaceae bacterium]